MTSKNISGIIDLSLSNQKITFDTNSFLGFSFDLILSAGATSTGTVYIYCQNTDPATSTIVYPAALQYDIASGFFANSATGQTVDSAYLTSARYCSIQWPIGDGAGTLEIIGQSRNYA